MRSCRKTAAAPAEDRSGRFGQGAWLVPYADDDMGQIMGARQLTLTLNVA
jgi:hypothetical protein